MSATNEQVAALWGVVPAIIGGVIGALAGGIPPWLIAKRQSDAALKRDREQRTALERAIVFRVHFKLSTIANSVVHDWLYFQTQNKALTDPCTAHMEPWQVLQPLVGSTDEGDIRFEAEEMAIFMAAGHRDFMSDLMLLAQRHGTGVAVMQYYIRLREELKAVAPHPEELDGMLGKGMISQEDLLKLVPYTAPLNSLALQMQAAADENLQLARKVSLGIGPIVKEYFGDPKAGGMSFPSDEELAVMLQERL
jgi:hypothetical protein